MRNNRISKEVWKVEVKKALRSKGFRVAVAIGILIAVLQMIWVYRNTYTVNESEYKRVVTLSEVDDGYGSWFEMGLLEGWLGCEVYSPYNQLYFLIFPLLASMTYALSYYNEWQSGYAGQMLVRCGRRNYQNAKFGVVFISGGLAVTIPLLISLVATACYLPAVGVEPLSRQAMVANRDIWSGLYYEAPVLYALCYTAVDFVYGGIFACMTLAGARWFSNRFAAVLFPMVVYCTCWFGLTSMVPDWNLYNVMIHIDPAQDYGTDQLAVLSLITILLLIVIVAVYWLSNHRRDITE